MEQQDETIVADSQQFIIQQQASFRDYIFEESEVH
jgi:hypothetical protein